MKRLIPFIVAALSLYAQVQPEGTSAVLYFPQFVDGGPSDGQQWQTTLTLTNLGWPENGATAILELFDNAGQPLAIDFGYGASATHNVYVPANGIRILRSRIGVSSRRTEGWARLRSTYPVQGTIAFRMFELGRPVSEVTAHSTQPTYTYISSATSRLGIAVANPSASASAVVALSVRDADGMLRGSKGAAGLRIGRGGAVICGQGAWG